jgi:hypothetical protein
LAVRLAQLAYQRDPAYGNGALASLMGTFETARAGGSSAKALLYFDQGIAMDSKKNAAPLVSKAEGFSLPAGDRAEFETLLRQALVISADRQDLQNVVMRERAQWLLSNAEDLF